MKYNFDEDPTLATALANLGMDFMNLKAAEALYKSSVETFTRLFEVALKDTTPDKPILNRDLANTAGINPSHMATIIRSSFIDNINYITVPVTTYFREVDEMGHIIEGGPVRARHYNILGYTGNN